MGRDVHALGVGCALRLAVAARSADDSPGGGVSVLAVRTSPPALIGLLTFSQIPAVTSYLHYAVGGASHPSFLVVGAVPWSDAWVHFHQAAQIALSGVTDHAFNGRFFYPLVLATAIWFAGWNLQLALALLLGLSLGAVALLARVIRPEAGWAGTSLFVLGCALYLRAHVAGLCMTESLGFLAGALGTACLLTGAAWRSPRWFFAGLFCVALGMAARPGALLVLPALGICAALVFGWRSAARMVLLLALSAVVVVAPFAANASLGHFVSSDSSKPFNNFAFSLHGMLLGEGWEESAAQTEHNPAVAIQRSKELLLAKPWLILSGYQRAWGYLAGKNFLFRFGQERRLAATMNLLAGLGLIGIWFLPGLRPQALWITLAAGGLILSLPLAPPWDASERPFAVTVPMQCLCAAVGLAWISAGVRRCARWPTALPRAETGLVIKPWTGALAAFALALSLVALLRAWMLFPSAGSQSWPPDFRHGSSRTIDNVREYRESLAFFLAGQGDKARDFSRIGEVAILAVDWGSLTTMAVRSPISSTQPKFVETDWVVLDPAILDAQTGAKQEQ